MAQEREGFKVFIDSDGSLTKLIAESVYNPDSAKQKPQQGEVIAVGKGKKSEDGKLIALEVQVGDRILFGKYSGSDIKLDGNEYMIMREDEILGVLTNGASSVKTKPMQLDVELMSSLSSRLMDHAVETFGSAELAQRWLSTECGALQNETPLDVIANTRTDAEVERILDCIDHGMIA